MHPKRTHHVDLTPAEFRMINTLRTVPDAIANTARARGKIVASFDTWSDDLCDLIATCLNDVIHRPGSWEAEIGRKLLGTP